VPKLIKLKALSLVRKGKQSKAVVAASIGVAPKTIYQWINEENQRLELLKPEQKIKLWERESIKDAKLAATARESLQKMLDSAPQSIATDTKRAIMHSASVVSGIKWDKSRLEAGQSTINISLSAVVRDSVRELITPSVVSIPTDRGVEE